MKRVAILQSSYIPWKGYFAIIALVDEFILGDDVQYTKQDWRNRNLIKTSTGATWLTIPVLSKGRSKQAIREVEIADRGWASSHWTAICTHYSRAPYFRTVSPALEKIYKQASVETRLSRINEIFLRAISEMLEIQTPITNSANYEVRGDRTDRIIHLCRQTGSQEYLTGPKARAYIDEQAFQEHRIRLTWMDYASFEAYSQLYTPPFMHEVTILDLLLNEGLAGAAKYMRSAIDLTRERLFKSRDRKESAADAMNQAVSRQL